MRFGGPDRAEVMPIAGEGDPRPPRGLPRGACRRPVGGVRGRPGRGVRERPGLDLSAPGAEWSRFLTIVLLSATLLLALWASGVHRHARQVATAIAGVVTVAAAVTLFGPEDIDPDLVGFGQLALILVVPPVIAIAVLRDLREAGAVTLRAVSGVLCVYLVIGTGFAYVDQLVEVLSSEAFFNEVGEGSVSDFLYFSFATLTTVGYGDLTAATQGGRSLAITEALIGQIYVITVVAIIIGNLGGSSNSR